MSNILWEQDDTNIIGVVLHFYSQNFMRHFNIFLRKGLYFHEQMHHQIMQALFLLSFDGNQRL